MALQMDVNLRYVYTHHLLTKKCLVTLMVLYLSSVPVLSALSRLHGLSSNTTLFTGLIQMVKTNSGKSAQQ